MDVSTVKYTCMFKCLAKEYVLYYSIPSRRRGSLLWSSEKTRSYGLPGSSLCLQLTGECISLWCVLVWSYNQMHSSL